MPGIDPWTYIFAAMLLLTLPLDWLLAAVFAALVHEMCHILCIYLLGGRIMGFRIGIGGAVIETGLSGRLREMLCALAGPAGSLLLVCLCHKFPKLAICACVQGIFNLLPIYPLDGGRALLCLLEYCWPERAEGIMKKMEIAILLCLLIAAISGTFVLSLGAMPLILSLTLIIKAVLRKRPCKRRKNGVQ